MNDFTIRPSRDGAKIRLLLLLSPFLVLLPLVQLCQIFLTPNLVNAMQDHTLFAVTLVLIPLGYIWFFLNSYYKRLHILRDSMYCGLFNRHRHPLDELVEVSGDAGSVKNDFTESLILEFASGEQIILTLDRYEEEKVKELLATLKRKCPQARFTYGEVLPLESRGLLRFLVDFSDSDTATVKLNSSPMEEMIRHLISTHEKTFFTFYFLAWFLVSALLCYYCALVDSSWAQNPGAQLIWDASSKAKELGIAYQEALVSAPSDYLRQIQIQALLSVQVTIDYFQSAGVEIIWMLWAAVTLALSAGAFVVIRYSPKFMFIDSKSIGHGMEFIPWNAVYEVSLKKLGKMSDPMDGTLIIRGPSKAVNIELPRIPNIKDRRRVLRLCDQHAVGAKFDDEFLRVNNALVDIQFTDMWLEEQSKAETASSDQEFNADGPETIIAGRYRVEAELGYGGQGTTHIARVVDSRDDFDSPAAQPLSSGSRSKVCSGRDLSPGTRVVVKQVIMPSYADVRIIQDARRRFEDGAELLSSLDHEQIVHLLEYVLEPDRAYLVMEYIPGKTLRTVVEEMGALDDSQVLDLGLQLCDILEFLHERESPIIHCDLAPDNLILTPSGKLKLVDFDVARVLDSRAHSFIAGRPSYTPPEQFRGKPVSQSDLFAMGAILHYLRNGSDPPPLGIGSSTIEEEESESDALSHLVQSCLQFDAENRPSRAAEVKQLLLAIRSGRETGTSSIHEVSVDDPNSMEDDTNLLSIETADDDSSSIDLSLLTEREKVEAGTNSIPVKEGERSG